MILGVQDRNSIIAPPYDQMLIMVVNGNMDVSRFCANQVYIFAQSQHLYHTLVVDLAVISVMNSVRK